MARDTAASADSKPIAPADSRGAPRASERGTKPRTGARSNADAVDEVAGIRITHPGRVLYPESNITKLDVARYYERIAPYLLPYVVRRPLSLVRCPQGPRGDCFFQKHATDRDIPGIDHVLITESGGEKPYVLVRSVQALAGLAQMNTLELHAWNARADDAERADMLVFDFDPDPAIAFAEVTRAVLQCRAVLSSVGLESFAKTTGGKGLHVVVPLFRRVAWAVVKPFARDVATVLAAQHPDRFVLKASKAARHARIFIDYLRNARGATAVVPYSLRAREGAPVSVPLYWNEVNETLDPRAFNLRTIDDRLARGGDPWAGYRTTHQTITAEMQRRLVRAA